MEFSPAGGSFNTETLNVTATLNEEAVSGWYQVGTVGLAGNDVGIYTGRHVRECRTAVDGHEHVAFVLVSAFECQAALGRTSR